MNAGSASMSGRALWVVLLLAATVVAGGLVGWRTAAPLYRSERLLVVEPLRDSPSEPDQHDQDAGLDGLIDAHAALISDERLLRHALQLEGMKNLHLPAGDSSLERLMRGIKVGRKGRGPLLFVAVQDESPEFAAKAVESTIQAYLEISQNQSIRRSQEELSLLADRLRSTAVRLRDISERIPRLAADYGGPTGLRAAHDAAVAAFAERTVSLTLSNARTALGGEPATEPAPSSEEPPRSRKEEAIARECDALRRVVADLGKRTTDLELLEEEGAGLRAERLRQEAEISRLRSELRGRGPLVPWGSGESPALPCRDDRPLRAVVGGLFGFLAGLLILAFSRFLWRRD